MKRSKIRKLEIAKYFPGGGEGKGSGQRKQKYSIPDLKCFQGLKRKTSIYKLNLTMQIYIVLNDLKFIWRGGG